MGTDSFHLHDSALDASWSELVLAAAGLATLGFTVMTIHQLVFTFGSESFQAGGCMRMYGPFDVPNQFAAYPTVTLPVRRSVGWRNAPRHRLAVTAFTARAGIRVVIVLVFKQWRARWFALGDAVVVVLTASSWKVQRMTAAHPARVMLVVIVGGAAGTLPGTDRFSMVAPEPSELVSITGEIWAQEERKAQGSEGGAMGRGQPVTGVGVGMVEKRYREFAPVWLLRLRRGQAHCGYLYMGAQAEIPGLVSLGEWMCGAFVLLAGPARRLAGLKRRIITGVLAAMMANIVGSRFEYLAHGVLLPGLAVLMNVGRSFDLAAGMRG